MGDPAAGSSPAETQVQGPKDCMSCRIIGTVTLAGTGSYALWQSRAVAPGTPLQKKGLALVGAGELTLLPTHHQQF